MEYHQADNALLQAMGTLVHDKGMLTGLTVCFGNRSDHQILSTGLAREVRYNGGAWESTPKAIHEHTIYDLASLTKVFTLVSVLQLMEQGALKGSDTIRHLDKRFEHLGDCTLASCLNYTAVLRTPQRVDRQPNPEAARAMVFQTRAYPPEGERLYSDMNALVLKYVVEALSGKPFMDYLTQTVLKPAGMAETWAKVPPHRADDLMDYNFEHKVIKGTYHLQSDVWPGLPHDPKARLLLEAGDAPSGHAGLFATAGDVCRFVQALLQGKLLKESTLLGVGVNQTGYLLQNNVYRQFLGLLCFSKSPIQRFSEVPEWMGLRAFGISGYTGNHLAIDPETGVFDLMLGNRCHNRVSLVTPDDDAEALGLNRDGSGFIPWPDGRQVQSSFRFIHQKDALVHRYTFDCLVARNWL